ncbi:hypothetical protein [Amycolatopsis sp. lyj-84]|uniref:hypothetical protein n=1 Tax=Amycolatopsis sp. lyj-84 TaxID=2789284 RepID=UPI00397AFC81
MSSSHTSQLHVVRLPGQRGLRVIGEVAPYTWDIWRTALKPVAVDAVPGKLDLARLAFIDTHGTTLLLDTARRRSHPASLTLTRLPKILVRMLPLLCTPETAKILIDEQATS